MIADIHQKNNFVGFTNFIHKQTIPLHVTYARTKHITLQCVVVELYR